MKTTTELIEHISHRYREVRNKNLDFLWEDFLQAVEKTIKQISDEKLAATSMISIIYFTQEGDEHIYRSKIAECSYFENQEVEYEKEDICLGTREMLEIAFVDFKEKAKKDNNICSDWFDVEVFSFDEDNDNEIQLDFILPKSL